MPAKKGASKGQCAPAGGKKTSGGKQTNPPAKASGKKK